MIELNKQKLNIIFAGIALIVLILCFILYMPLARRLKAQVNETKTLEVELINARNIVTSMTRVETRTDWTTEDNLPIATDELVKLGGRCNVNFASIMPGELVRGDVYGMLPVDIILVSGYSELGNFLGALDGLKKSVVKVNEFEVYPSKTEPSKLKAKLTLNMYVLK